MNKYEPIKHMIYSDWDMFDLADNDEWWEEQVESGYADETDDRWGYVYQEMQFRFEDEQANLDVDVGNTILAIAKIGAWDGTHCGYREIDGTHISDCLVREHEYCEWWCDASNFRAKMSHHDGTNYILYRRRKDGITDYQWDNFLYKLYKGEATAQHISKYTTSLLPYIAEVYGWKYRKYAKTNHRYKDYEEEREVA